MNWEVHLPLWITRLFPRAAWTIPGRDNEVYLTFDDGPVPDITPKVLEILQQKKVSATFFCVGENVARYPEIFDRILTEGHAVGNHTYNHLQGHKTRNDLFFSNIEKAGGLVKSDLFRPPHGWLKPSQYRYLSKRYKLIMWDVISVDYNPATSPEKCLWNVLHYTRSGSIITFHDSEKAAKNLLYALPRAIDELKKEGLHSKR